MRSLATPLAVAVAFGVFAGPAAAREADVGPKPITSGVTAETTDPASPLLSPRRFNRQADRTPIRQSSPPATVAGHPASRPGEAPSGGGIDAAPFIAGAGGIVVLLGFGVLGIRRRRSRRALRASVPRTTVSRQV